MCMPMTPIHSYCFFFVFFAAAHPLSNPTNTTQPLQVPKFTFARAWEQQRVHLPSEKPTHVPGYHDSSLPVSSSHIIVHLWELKWLLRKKEKRLHMWISMSLLFLHMVFLICVFLPLQNAGINWWIFWGMRLFCLLCSTLKDDLHFNKCKCNDFFPDLLFFSVLFSSAAVQSVSEDQPDGQQQRPLL